MFGPCCVGRCQTNVRNTGFLTLRCPQQRHEMTLTMSSDHLWVVKPGLFGTQRREHNVSIHMLDFITEHWLLPRSFVLNRFHQKVIPGAVECRQTHSTSINMLMLARVEDLPPSLFCLAKPLPLIYLPLPAPGRTRVCGTPMSSCP